MINQILMVVILVISGFSVWQYLEKKSLETDNHNKDMAILTYEAMIKTVPFEALTGERKDNADEKVKVILHDNTAIFDAVYERM